MRQCRSERERECRSERERGEGGRRMGEWTGGGGLVSFSEEPIVLLVELAN